MQRGFELSLSNSLFVAFSARGRAQSRRSRALSQRPAPTRSFMQCKSISSQSIGGETSDKNRITRNTRRFLHTQIYFIQKKQSLELSFLCRTHFLLFTLQNSPPKKMQKREIWSISSHFRHRVERVCITRCSLLDFFFSPFFSIQNPLHHIRFCV